ncbi:MAG: hypothetical protein IJB45_01680 [Clostridia bacterium]|nr:hypothetical protein [Clostridia bacterium]
MNIFDLPLGLGMALAQNEQAMQKFEHLSDSEKRAFVEITHSVSSKSEMRSLVNSLINGKTM